MKQAVKMRRVETWTFDSRVPKVVATSKIKEHFSEKENVIGYRIVKTWHEGNKINFKVSVDLS